MNIFVKSIGIIAFVQIACMRTAPMALDLVNPAFLAGPLSGAVGLQNMYPHTGSLFEEFDEERKEYRLFYPANRSSFQLAAIPLQPDSILELRGGQVLEAGQFSADIPLNMGENSYRILVRDPLGLSEEEYTLRVFRGVESQQAYFKAGSPGADDEYGWSFAVSVDTLVVGSPFEDSAFQGIRRAGNAPGDDGSSDAGAVYVYRLQEGKWLPEAYIKAPNSAVSEEFGYQVALSGDLLAISAFREGTNALGILDGGAIPTTKLAANLGAVYLYRRSFSGVWNLEAFIKPHFYNAGNFGYSLALSGNTLAISSIYDNNGLGGVQNTSQPLNGSTVSGSGAVYVYVAQNGRWSLESYIKAPVPYGDEQFGQTLALHGDTLAVAAPREGGNYSGVHQASGRAGIRNGSHDVSGAVYLYRREQGAWRQEAYLKAPNNTAGFKFGQGLALYDESLVVGAPAEDHNGSGIQNTAGFFGITDGACDLSGAVYVYGRSGAGVWEQQAYIKADNNVSGNQFGASVSLYKDRLLIGAPKESGPANGISQGASVPGQGSSQSGAAYLFYRENGLWYREAYLKAGQNVPGDLFGSHVNLSGGRAFIGAPGDARNASGIHSGAGAAGILDGFHNDSGSLYFFK